MHRKLFDLVQSVLMRRCQVTYLLIHSHHILVSREIKIIIILNIHFQFSCCIPTFSVEFVLFILSLILGGFYAGKVLTQESVWTLILLLEFL